MRYTFWSAAIALALTAVMAYAPSPARAAGCDGFDLRSIVSGEDYYRSRMAETAPVRPGALSLEHIDDPHIAVSFEVEAIAPPPDMTRRDYIESVRLSIDRSMPATSRDNVISTAISPYDPITWVITNHQAGRVVTGKTVMRLSRSCLFVADWRILESTALAGRSGEFLAAMDTLKSVVETVAEKGGFLDERLVPRGTESLLAGFVGPLLAGLILMFMFRDMVHLGRAGVMVKGLSFGIVLVAAAAVGLEYKVLVASLGTLLYLDHLLVLTAVSTLAALAIVSNHQLMTLAAMCVAIAGGLGTGTETVLGWVPDPLVAGLASGCLVVLGGLGLMLWRLDFGEPHAVMGTPRARTKTN